jgi:CDP-diacylglycerol--serine O-phosphatidyltransferase
VRAWWVAIPWLIFVGLGGFLMVSTWRFWSGKEINFARSHPFQLLFVLAIVFYVVLRYSNVVLFALALTYTFSGIWARAAYGWSRRRRRRPAEIAGPDDGTAEPDSLRPL